MLRKLTRSSIAAVATALMIGGVALPAGARTTVAFVGRPNNPAEAGCFGEWFGSMRNYCGTPSYFTVPLTVDVAGYHYATVYAYGATASNNVGCAAFGVFNSTTDTATYYGSGTYWLTRFGAASAINLPATYVPAAGSLFAACTVNPGGQINLVNTTW